VLYNLILIARVTALEPFQSIQSVIIFIYVIYRVKILTAVI